MKIRDGGWPPFALVTMDDPMPTGASEGLRRAPRGLVGAAGFEPAASWSRTTRANQATLRPEASNGRADLSGKPQRIAGSGPAALPPLPQGQPAANGVLLAEGLGVLGAEAGIQGGDVAIQARLQI